MGGAKFLGWVTLIVAALVCGTVFLAIRSAPETVTADQLADERSRQDPSVGESFKLGVLKGEPVLLVTLGTCLGCAVQKTDFSVLKDVRSFKVIGVYEKNAELENVSDAYPWLEVAEDSDGAHQSLNSYWTPRVYAFDEAGTLLAMQRSGEDLNGFLSRMGVPH
ncbi:MAG: hypothetical protein WD716_07340 [Fimbriimonadaceae bacterium]